MRAVGQIAQRAAERGYLHGQVIFFHGHAAPDMCQDFVTGDEAALLAGEEVQNLEGAGTQRHRHAIARELPPRWIEAERPELIDGERFAHTLFLTTPETVPTRERPVDAAIIDASRRDASGFGKSTMPAPHAICDRQLVARLT